MIRLADFTTFHIGGEPASFLEPATEDELIDAVAQADRAGRPIMVLGGGSNVLFADDFHGHVVRVSHTGWENDASACAGAWVTVQAGQSWDAFVAHAVDSGWAGVEALAGIPGTVGATPLQNVGAYGQQVSDTIAQVRVWDRAAREVRTLFAADCEFGYRASVFKRDPSRWLVLSVTFQLRLGDMSDPISYDEVARHLGIPLGERVPLADMRACVLALRQSKGMVVDPLDHDTWSVGSFFLNPRVAQVPAGAPAWPQPDGSFKVSAAWLIEQAGFGRGFTLDGKAALSSKHTLALCNRGGATAADVMALADHVQAGVAATFGIRLELEPRVIH